jgi:3-oxoacyl-[acyl-carrier protein] reductase
MDLGLADRVYLVTGGTGGLGHATAAQLVAEGARVVISGLKESDAVAAAEALGEERALGIAADNADPSAADSLVAAATRTFGRLDGVLISVGGPPSGAVMDVTDDTWRASFETVFLGAIRIARTVAATLDEGGSIAFVLSASVRAPFPNMAISNGLRPGLGMIAKTLSQELGPRGVRVNGLMPAWFTGPRAAELIAAGGPVNSLLRRGTPEEFGRVATFVLSPAASYLTGAMIAIDGGALPTI